MKNSIQLTALFLLAGASLFAVAPVKAATVPGAGIITFSSLPTQKGIEVKVGKNEKALVTISDQAGNVLRKDVLSNKKSLGVDYILTNLDNGDYTIEVTSKGRLVKEDIHIYDEGETKMFFVKS
jgi:hypothetical protein